MLSILASSAQGALPAVAQRLRLIWKSPDGGRYHEVGHFEALVDGRFAFGYNEQARTLAGFAPLTQFPDFSHVYVSDVLPAFLANRVMSDRRESYGQYLHWLGLKPGSTPVEVLARTGGARATDTFHVVDAFDFDADGRCEGRFFVSGIRHTPNGPQLAARLLPGAELAVKDDPENPVNSRALLLSSDGAAIGWIPDWLVEEVHRIRSAGELNVIVEQINRDAPSHLKVLCHLRATALEAGAHR